MSISTPQVNSFHQTLIRSWSDVSQDYAIIPGGSCFLMTSRGTRIFYERSFLLKCRASPMANALPTNLPDIPGITRPEKDAERFSIKFFETSFPKQKEGHIYLSGAFRSAAFSPLFGQSSVSKQNSAARKPVHGAMITEHKNNEHRSDEMDIRNQTCKPIVNLQQQAYGSTNLETEPVGGFNAVKAMLDRSDGPPQQLHSLCGTKSSQIYTEGGIQANNSTSFRPNNLRFVHSRKHLPSSNGTNFAHQERQFHLSGPLEKLLKAASSLPFPPHRNAVYNSCLPAYGHYE